MIGFLYPLISSASFSISSVIIRKLDYFASPLKLNVIRTSVGASCFIINLFILGLFHDLIDLPWIVVLYLILSVLFNVALGDTFYFTAQRILGVRIVNPIVNTFPLLTIILAVIFLDEKFSTIIIIGSILILTGISLISIEKEGETENILNKKLGVIFIGLTIISYALGVIFTTVGTVNLDPITANSVRLPFAAIFLGSVYTFSNKTHLPKDEVHYKLPTTITFAILTGVLGTYISSIYLVLSVQTIGAGLTSVFVSVGPLFALPLAKYWLKENVGIKTIIGTLLTIAGIIIVVA